MPTDAQTLINNARCLDCIPPGERMAVLISLAAQIAAGGGGGGGGVTSVFGRAGAVVADCADYAACYVLKVGDTMTGLLTIAQATANTEAFAISGYSLTGANAQPMVNLAGTWNTTGAPTALLLNITNTASGAAALLMDLQVGGASRFSVSKAGEARAVEILVGASNTGFYNSGGTLAVQTLGVYRSSWAASVFSLAQATRLGWESGGAGTAMDATLQRDAAGVIAQRDTANAQAFRWYRTFTDAANYERGALQTAAGQVILAAETAGTGTDDIDVVLTPAGIGNVVFPGGVLLRTSAALTNGAAAALGTLSNAPAAGNPTKWVPVNDNGTTRYVPMW